MEGHNVCEAEDRCKYGAVCAAEVCRIIPIEM